MGRWQWLKLCGSPSFVEPGSVKAGYFAVYVGPERKRFVIPTRFLNLPVFVSLLEKTEEEFGFRSGGSLEFPCDPSFFQWVVGVLEKDDDHLKGLELEEFLRIFSQLGYQTSSSTC